MLTLCPPAGILFALLSFLYGKRKLATHRSTKEQVRQLVKTALSELSKQVSHRECICASSL